MKKAKIYKPTKTVMQSGLRNTKNWLLEFDTLNTGINPLNRVGDFKRHYVRSKDGIFNQRTSD